VETCWCGDGLLTRRSRAQLGCVLTALS
jgi:hypothetical protein